MRLAFLCIGLLFACGCEQKTPPETTTITTFETDIPRERTEVNKTPVASYRSSEAGGKNGPFVVELFETKRMHKFLMRLENNGFVDKDTFTVPAFTPDPVVQIKPGAQANECIAGFLDKKGEFMAYKKVISTPQGVQVKILKRFGTRPVLVGKSSMSKAE